MAINQALMLACSVMSMYKQPPVSKGQEEATQSEWTSHARAVQLSARHSQGSGIGYTQGYSTLEAFLAPRRCEERWSPFVDLRGHLFNNGKFASNAGVGVRRIGSEIAWGGNVYYDYRRTHHFHYNQLSAGLEAIGSFWSVHLNGYLPVGNKKSRFFDFSSGAIDPPQFSAFQGHHILINDFSTPEIRAKREFAFKGVDLQASFRVWQGHRFALDSGVGAYYFQGYYGQHAPGGQAHVTTHLTDYISLKFHGSYDNVFHQRGQVEVGFSIPIGGKSFSHSCQSARTFPISAFYDFKLAKGASRSEIVAVNDAERTVVPAAAGNLLAAINPLTGLPYEVWFVNNTSSSLGTYESPYPTLQEALAMAQPADVIYVYPGSGAPYDIDGMTLLNNQFLLGSGLDQTLPTPLGPITLTAQSATYPTMTNSTGSSIVTVASGNTLSGFNLEVLQPGDTVVGSAITDLFFLNNTYLTAVSGGIRNIVLSDCSGSIVIKNNQFNVTSSDSGSYGIVVNDTAAHSAALSVLENTFTGHGARAISLNYAGSSSPHVEIAQGNLFTFSQAIAGTNAIDIATSNSTTLVSDISGNTFTGHTSDSIRLNLTGSGDHSIVISHNSLSSDPSILGTRGVAFSATANSALSVSNNQFYNQSAQGIDCFCNQQALFSFDMTSNTFLAPSSGGLNGIRIFGTADTQLTGSITNNTLQDHIESGINLFVDNSATIDATVHYNTITAQNVLNANVGIYGSCDNNAAVTSSFDISYNTVSGHLSSEIQSFPNQLSIVSFNISHNTLTSAPLAAAGTDQFGILIGPGGAAQLLNTTIAHNNWTSPITYNNTSTPRGININLPTQVTASAITITDNTTLFPLSAYHPNRSPQGIHVGVFNNALLDVLTLSNNAVTFSNGNYIADCSPQGLVINTNDNGQLNHSTVTGNTVLFADITNPSIGNFFPSGIQVNAGGYSTGAPVTASFLVQHNTVTIPAGTAISLSGYSGTAVHPSFIEGTIDQNSVTAPLNGANASGINASTSDYAQGVYIITGNNCTGHTNGSIQSYINGFSQASIQVHDNTLTAASQGLSSVTPVNLQISASGNAQLLSASVTDNVCIGVSTYHPSSTPQLISIGAGDNTPGSAPLGSNITISGNTLTMPLTTLQALTTPTALNIYAYGAAELSNVLVTQNTLSFPNSSYDELTGVLGIQLSASNNPPMAPGSSIQNATISDNTITFAPLLAPLEFFSGGGINVSANDPLTTIGTSLSPILITHNIITDVENSGNAGGAGIGVFSGSDSDCYVTVSHNQIKMGGTEVGSYGIFTLAGGSGQLNTFIDSNTVDGSDSSFFGVLALSFSSTCQECMISSNTIFNVHANNPDIPIPNAGGGIGVIPQASGAFNVVINDNALSGNTPNGFNSIHPALFGAAGSVCITLANNHGIGALPADNYRLLNPTSAPAAAFKYYDGGNNTGTIILDPSSADFTQVFAPCNCP